MKKIQLFLVILLASCLTVAAQDMRATGKVTFASDGDAVIGATVKVKGTQIVAITDINGGYTITLPASAEKVLEISYTGFKTVSIGIPQSGNYDIQLEEDALVLGGTEGLVVIGYGSPRRAGTVVGSSSKVESKEFESRPAASAFDALQGKVAGLQIYTSSGQPGTMQSVRLHGVGSINSSTTPLYLIDGVPVDGQAVLSLNANDIESTTILKDASATSIYGSRAANGVIYISTKRGAVGQKARVVVSSFMGIETLANKSYYDHIMGTDETFRFFEEAKIVNVAQLKRNLISGKILDPNSGGFWDTNWIEYLQPNTYVNNVDFSVTGGTESVSYFVSASKYHQGGTVPGTSYDRMTLRANLDMKVNKYLKVGLNISASLGDKRTNPYFGSNYTSGGLSYMTQPFYSPYSYDDLSEPMYYPGTGTISLKYIAEKQKWRTKTYTTNLSGYIVIEPVKNLIIRSQPGVNFQISQVKNQTFASFLGQDNGSIARGSNTYTDRIISNTIEYTYEFGNKYKHAIIAIVGQEGIRRNGDTFSFSGDGIRDDMVMQGGAITNKAEATLSSGYTESRLLSFFGRAEYAFDNRLFFEASVRSDKSSRFAKGHNQKAFWALGGKWNLKNEKWLKDVSMLDNLELKLSYGTQGNEGIQNQYSIGVDFAPWMLMGITKYGGQSGWYNTSPGNDELTWETQEKFTVGVQATLWSKLSLNLEYYRRVSKDLHMEVPMPYTSGFTSILKNIGELKNQGIDLELSYSPLRGRDYFLTLNANFNYNEQKTTKIFDPDGWWYRAGYQYGMTVGEPIQYWSQIYAGVNTQTGAPQWYLPYVDKNGVAQPQIGQKDKGQVTGAFSEDGLLQNTGKPLYAPFAGGFGLSAGWKGIGLDVHFTYSIGKYMWDNDRFFSENPLQFPGYAVMDWVWDYWKKDGDNTEYPNFLDKNHKAVQDSRYLHNASFMRLKNITLSYEFKKEWLKKTGFLEGAQIYVSGRNLWTVTHKAFRGIDPEVDSNLTIGGIGNSREFIVGVKLTF